MRRSARLVSVLAAFSLPFGGFTWGGNAPIAGPVRRITREPVEFGDLSQVLKIQKAVATCELTDKASRFRLRIDFYEKGKKLEKKTQACGLELTEGENVVKCAVHLIDLDYLPLGGGKPGHQRVHYQLGASAASFGTSFDIAKSDFHGGASINVFSPKDTASDHIPILYAIANTNRITAGRTPDEVVRLNPDADVCVVTLELH